MDSKSKKKRVVSVYTRAQETRCKKGIREYVGARSTMPTLQEKLCKIQAVHQYRRVKEKYRERKDGKSRSDHKHGNF